MGSAGVAGMVHLEGSQFGARVVGMLDHALALLAEAIALAPAIGPKVLSARLWQPLCRQLASGGHGELSPRGVTSLLQLLRLLLVPPATNTASPGAAGAGAGAEGEGGSPDRRVEGGGGGAGTGVSPGPKTTPNAPAAAVSRFIDLVEEGVVRAAGRLLSEGRLEALRYWPLPHGGGVRGISALVQAVAGVLRVPLPPQQCPKDVLIGCQQSMHSERIVGGVVASLRATAQRLDTGPPHMPVDLLTRLVLLSSNFLNQVS